VKEFNQTGKKRLGDKMNKFAVKLGIIFLGFCFTAALFAIEVPLKYEKYPDAPKSFLPSGSVQLNIRPRGIPLPGDPWTFPHLNTENPAYAFAKIGDKERLFVLDIQKKGDSSYNRLYFDANGNHNLRDDPVFDALPTSKTDVGYPNVRFPAIDATIEVDGKSLPYSFRPVIYGYMMQMAQVKPDNQNISRYMNIRLLVNCAYTSEFQIDSQKYRLILGDKNCNGRFDDKLTFLPSNRIIGRVRLDIFAKGDSFNITSGEKIESYDEQVCGDWLLVNDKLFEVSISTAKGVLSLTPINENLAALKLAMSTERISLYTEDGKHCLIMYQPAKEIKIPQGRYKLLSYEVLRKDEQGDLWRLCAAATKESPFMTLGEGQFVYEFGEPYVPIVDVHKTGGRLDRFFFVFNVEGKAKELLTDLSHISGTKTFILLSEKKNLGHRPKEPTYKVMKADGEVVKSGFFEYG
jgi:hypothetical protein